MVSSFRKRQSVENFLLKMENVSSDILATQQVTMSHDMALCIYIQIRYVKYK